MVREAVFHSTDSEYCHALDCHTIVIRLRAKRGDLTCCVLCYGDRVYPKEIVRVDAVEMAVVASDELFDYYESIIQTDLTRICYYFLLSDGTVSLYYYGYAFHDKLEYNRNQYFQLSYVRREDIADVPAWAKEAILYQVFPDSFASGFGQITGERKEIPVGCTADTVARNANNENHRIMKKQLYSKSKLGGTLRGILENLSYLETLGINCLYLTPIFTAGEYHRYDTIDYFSVDPCFGDMETLKQLVSECHTRGIRVLLDGVFNHCGENFFAFRDVLENGGKSRYRDWFFIRDYPVTADPPNYECFAYVKSMPKLNTGNPEVVAYFTGVAEYWIRKAGIDGWRLDVANEVNHDFWRDFRKAVKKLKPDAFLIGEIWFDAREWLMGDQFDSLMNYGFSNACIDFFAKRVIQVKQFEDRMDYLRMRYRKNLQQVQMNLLDSHDVPRFLSLAGGDIRKLKLAVLFMMTHIGIPTVYYGDEKGMEGLKEADYRKPMLWKDTEASRELTDFYRKLISIRKKTMDRMTGEYQTLDADLVCNTLVYSRAANGKKLFVILNNSEFPVQYMLDAACCGQKTEHMKGVPIISGNAYSREAVVEADHGTILRNGFSSFDDAAGQDKSQDVPADAKGIDGTAKAIVINELLSGRQYRSQGSVVTVVLEALSGVILEQQE